ncbi:3-methyladenine DNA glycosylase [Rothia sp. L_38]|uniref:3-methyladenine DNA glycosylase n=1 Tax=Rothia sp. L_38 TaxID=3422315 RepID=UPI003D6C0A7D
MPLTLLAPDDWRALARAHEERSGRYALPFARRRERGQAHPVEDFLFTYYTLKPGQFMRWHPGAGVILQDAGERADWKFYRAATQQELEEAGLPPAEAAAAAQAGTSVLVDTEKFAEARTSAIDFARIILGETAAKPGFFGCFGLHEWAMAYKSVENNIRHDYLELRLGAEGTDRVVESHKIRCSHFDAFRFFMPQAAPMNELQPTREQQRNLEQPACLHANMDIYKWAYKLLPLVPSHLVMDCFELAWDVRELDMKTAPYDLRDWGYEPVAIETPQGKAEYVRQQRGFAERSVLLRQRLLAELDRHLGQTETE